MPTASMSTASDLERYMLELVNAERAAYGLPPVTLELTMNSATEDHSQWMSDANTFSHTGAGGSTPTARMLAAGLDLSGSWTTAENIAAVTVSGSGSYYDEVAQLHQNLMDSPGHRANILNPDVTWIGIGIVVGPLSFSGGSPRDAVLVTQNFAYASAGVPRLDLAGGEVADVLVGGAGADHIDGRGGNDVLRTGAGDDTVLGGAGNDRIEVMLGQGDKTIDGGTGTDTVVLSLDQSDVSGSWQGSTLVLDTGYGTLRLANVETLQFADGAVSAADFGDGRYTRIQGTTAAEGLTGSAEDDLILGAGGADTLTGLAGDDILLADPGAMARLDQGAEVYRLFDTVFGREPGRSGLEGFATGLLTGQSSLESLAESFMASAEFALRYGDTTDAEFITLLFNNVFGRDPSATGLAAWTARLATESRAEIILAFSETAEHVNLTRDALEDFAEATSAASWTDEVYRLFGAVLGREPGAAGLASWTEALAGGRSLSEAVAQFMDSAEFNAIYGATTDEEFITLLFQNVLERDPAATGLEAWTARLEAGETRVSVVESFMNTAEYVLRTTEALTDYMRASPPDDRLQPGAGDSTLSGGYGADSFVFASADDGRHEIVDFEAWDVLDLTGFGYGSAGEALSHFTQSGDDLVFSDQGVTVVINGWQLTDFEAEMLDF